MGLYQTGRVSTTPGRDNLFVLYTPIYAKSNDKSYLCEPVNLLLFALAYASVKLPCLSPRAGGTFYTPTTRV